MEIWYPQKCFVLLLSFSYHSVLGTGTLHFPLLKQVPCGTGYIISTGTDLLRYILDPLRFCVCEDLCREETLDKVNQ